MERQNHETEYERELQRKGLLAMESGQLTPVKSGGRWFNLLTPRTFAALPDGTVVVSVVSHKQYVKGQDTIDLDVRGGQIAYGLPIDDEQSAQLSALYKHLH